MKPAVEDDPCTRWTTLIGPENELRVEGADVGVVPRRDLTLENTREEASREVERRGSGDRVEYSNSTRANGTCTAGVHWRRASRTSTSSSEYHRTEVVEGLVAIGVAEELLLSVEDPPRYVRWAEGVAQHELHHLNSWTVGASSMHDFRGVAGHEDRRQEECHVSQAQCRGRRTSLRSRRETNCDVYVDLLQGCKIRAKTVMHFPHFV